MKFVDFTNWQFSSSLLFWTLTQNGNQDQGCNNFVMISLLIGSNLFVQSNCEYITALYKSRDKYKHEIPVY